MKKSLIALAALATVGAAQAQSSVTLYGVLDSGYGDIEKTSGTTKFEHKAFSFSNYTTSRWGIRGTEDLGGGLRASFNLESGMTSDMMAGYWQTGAATNGSNSASAVSSTASNSNGVGTDTIHTRLGDRAAFATLSNSSGTTVGIGFASTAVRDISLKYDAAGGSRLVGNLVTMDAALSSNRATGIAVAQKLGNLTVRAGLSQNNTQSGSDAETKSRSGWLAAAEYSAGKFEAAYARQEIKSTTPSGTTLTSDAKQTVDMVGASYDLGVAKLFASYANIKLEEAGTNGTASTTTALTTTANLFSGVGKRSYTTLGASAPVGKAVLFATVSEGSINQNISGATNNTKRDMSGYTVGARYNLSKRTFGYAAVGQAKIDATSGTTNYYKVEQMTAGVAHSF